jgi:hypothetical protein
LLIVGPLIIKKVWTDDPMKCNTSILNTVRDKILDFAEKKLRDDFPCSDYKEFLQLIIIFFRGKLKGNINF